MNVLHQATLRQCGEKGAEVAVCMSGEPGHIAVIIKATQWEPYSGCSSVSSGTGHISPSSILKRGIAMCTAQQFGERHRRHSCSTGEETGSVYDGWIGNCTRCVEALKVEFKEGS